MTSASVKDLSSVMNFVGGSAKAQSDQMKPNMSFGDVMNKAGNNQNFSESESRDTKVINNSKTNVQEHSKVNRQESVNKQEKVSDKDAVTSENEVTDNINDNSNKLTDNKEVLENAGSDQLKEIADELEISEEELLEAMETLGLSVISLLDPANLSKLVLEVSGEEDSMALVTNEELFNTVKNLTTMTDAVVADLAQDMDMEVPDLKELITQYESIQELEDSSEEDVNPIDRLVTVVDDNNRGMEMSVEANSDLDQIRKPETKLTQKVEETDETVDILTDKNGNEIKTVTVEDKTDMSDENSSEGDKKGYDQLDHNKNRTSFEESDGQQGLSNKTPIFSQQINTINNAALDNLPNVAENSLNNTPFVSEETSRIMDQIMERMKISLGNDINELEMQLHPASLGSVKVNLTSKAGEVTAELKVQNELVKNAVEAQLNDLRETFRASGAKVTAIEVSVELQSFDSNLWQGKGHDGGEDSQGQGKRKPRRLSIEDIDKLFADEEASEEDILAASMLQATGGTVDYTA